MYEEIFGKFLFSKSVSLALIQTPLFTLFKTLFQAFSTVSHARNFGPVEHASQIDNWFCCYFIIDVCFFNFWTSKRELLDVILELFLSSFSCSFWSSFWSSFGAHFGAHFGAQFELILDVIPDHSSDQAFI